MNTIEIQEYIKTGQLPREAMRSRHAAMWDLSVLGMATHEHRYEYWVQHLTLGIEIERAEELVF